MKKFDWVVVANGSQARILEKSISEDSEWKEVACLVHPDARAHGSGTDGKSRHHTISGRRGLAPRQEEKEHHREKFCKQIAEKIKEGSTSNRINELVIFASSPVLGELLHQMKEDTKKLVLSTHSKDLTSLTLPELTKRFREEFAL